MQKLDKLVKIYLKIIISNYIYPIINSIEKLLKQLFSLFGRSHMNNTKENKIGNGEIICIIIVY